MITGFIAGSVVMLVGIIIGAAIVRTTAGSVEIETEKTYEQNK